MRYSRPLLSLGAALALALAGPANAVVSPLSGDHVSALHYIVCAKGGGVRAVRRVATQTPAPSIGRSSSGPAPSVGRSPTSAYTAPPPAPAPSASVGRSPPTQAPAGASVGRVRTDAIQAAPVQAVPGATVDRSGTAPLPLQASAPPPLPRTAVDTAIARGQSQFQSDQKQFAKLPVGSPQTAQAARTDPLWNRYGSGWHSADDYYVSRNARIAALPPDRRMYWEHPPLYVTRSAPAYGSYSGVFLGGLLAGGAIVAGAEMSADDPNARWAYAHRNDPAYVQWHNDMMSQAQENAELRQRLDVLDRQVGVLQERNAVVNPDELPPGVDPAMVVAPETAMLATAAEPADRGLLWPAVAIVGILVIFGIYRAMSRSRFA